MDAPYPETEEAASVLRGLEKARRKWENGTTKAKKTLQGAYQSLFTAAAKKGLVIKGSPPEFFDWRKEFAGCSEELRTFLGQEFEHQEASSSKPSGKRTKPEPKKSKAKVKPSKRQKTQQLSEETVPDSDDNADEASGAAVDSDIHMDNA